MLRLTLRAAAKASRLVELVHRAVPYPLLAVDGAGRTAGPSAAHKRWSQGEAGKTVLEGDVVTADWDAERDGEIGPPSATPWRSVSQPRATLHALYQGWIDTLLALHAARVTGAFAIAGNAEHAAPVATPCKNARGSMRRSLACVPPPRKRSRWRGEWN